MAAQGQEAGEGRAQRAAPVQHARGRSVGAPLAAPPAVPAADRPRRRRSDDVTGWLFALPHLSLFVTFLLLPVAYGFWISLHRWHVLAREHPFVGLANYQAALSDDIFRLALFNTLYFVVLVVPAGNLVSLLLALGLSNVRRFVPFYRAAYYLPAVVSIAVVAVLWRWLYNTEVGLLNAYLGALVNGFLRGTLGLSSVLPAFRPLPWLANPSWVIPSLALMTVWWTAGGNMILYLAGLGAIPEDYYEAAKIDGAGAWSRFWHVTWPLLRPTALFCVVISVLGSFQVFGQSYVLFSPGSGPARSGLTLALYMYQQGFNQYEIGYAAAIGYLLFALVLALTVIQFRLFGREKGEAKG